jgi:ribosomal protein L11 methyltransferase
VIRLAVRVRRDQAELVLAELLELAPGGVEEREDGDVVEYAVYGAPGELPELPALRAAAGGALVEVATTEIADDWDKRWKAFHAPVELGGLRVRPPWEPPREGPIDVVIDPAQAFGTGAHATTRLCLELLLELEPGGALVDVGCGSGVLAIAAARLGWAPVLGVDHDREAVRATIANAAANGVELEARRHDLLHDGPAPSATEDPRRQRAAGPRGRRGRRGLRAPRPARGRSTPRGRLDRAVAGKKTRRLFPTTPVGVRVP